VFLFQLFHFDNSYLIEKVKSQWANAAKNEVFSNLKDERWLQLDKANIKHLFVLHGIENNTSKRDLAYIALKNHITINDAQIARAGLTAEIYYQEQYHYFIKGKLLQNTLYVGLKNEPFYPQQYCMMLDEYVVCSLEVKRLSRH
jgi:hypothetical protein